MRTPVAACCRRTLRQRSSVGPVCCCRAFDRPTRLRSLIALHGVGETRTGGILIVDDEKPNLTVLRNFLEAGYRVYEAQSGDEALEIAKATALDVIIADQRMPEMTGVELLEKLRDFKPDVAGIILTAVMLLQA